jgi:hypothetical protein
VDDLLGRCHETTTAAAAWAEAHRCWTLREELRALDSSLAAARSRAGELLRDQLALALDALVDTAEDLHRLPDGEARAVRPRAYFRRVWRLLASAGVPRAEGHLWPDDTPGAPRPGLAGPDLAAAVAGWYRELARKYHPDAGGSNEAMAALNHAVERLKTVLGLG